MVPDGLDSLGNVLEATAVVMSDSTDFAVHDLARISVGKVSVRYPRGERDRIF